MFFQYLLGLPQDDLHLEIFVGDLVAPMHGGDENARDTILRGLLAYNPRQWATVDHEEFSDAVFAKRIFVIAVDGLFRRIQDDLDHRFRKQSSSYLGAIEVDPANRVHWTLYRHSLVPRYRYVDGTLRLFYREFEERAGGDVKDTGMAKDLERLGFRVTSLLLPSHRTAKVPLRISLTTPSYLIPPSFRSVRVQVGWSCEVPV